ncbi:MAG: glycosyltransferase [Alphaproteobacteria bacterium]|nr:glycosyltransferase [Alphaproteobacteria bacterium]
MTPALAVAAISLGIWCYLLAGRGLFFRTIRESAHGLPEIVAPPQVVAIVPARDEADGIGETVRSLLRQTYRGDLQIIVIDDHSTDGTARIAANAAREVGGEDRLIVLTGRDLPRGWTGKVWAQAQGVDEAERRFPEARYLLLTDADIAHAPDSVAGLVARAEAGGLDLVSLMVRLASESFFEKLLVPAFVFFFQKLYPFAWVNRPGHPAAAAAGGCMLVRRQALRRIGGMSAIAGRLIDDCSLAAAIKRGGPVWLGLAHETRSLRRYRNPADVWRMVARTAYTQLDHSPLNLAAAALGMILTYLAPPILALVTWGEPSAFIGLLVWGLMCAAFLPMLRYYRLSPLWAAALPAIALFYLGATLDSGRRHWLGRGGEWKGRVQVRSDA